MKSPRKNYLLRKMILVFVLFPDKYSQKDINSFEIGNMDRIFNLLKSRYNSPNADMIYKNDWKCKNLTWIDKHDLNNKMPKILDAISDVLSPSGMVIEPDIIYQSLSFSADPETGALIIGLPIARDLFS